MAVILKSDEKDLGEFTVARILPNEQKKMVGPFIFFDQMGPAHFKQGKGINVRPHPHIGLATITYLFSGSILHRDSLANSQEIFPGDVNWMTAGRGIVHSERETLEVRSQDHELYGIQTWLALPEEKAGIEPSFSHVKKCNLPHIIKEKIMMRLIAGDAYGHSSPIKTFSPMFYLDVVADSGAVIEHPDQKQEAAIFIQRGQVQISGEVYSSDQFVLLEDGDQYLEAKENCRFLLLGGEAFVKIPYIHWNFVAYNKKRIEQARQQWQDNRFPSIPHDDFEKIPLPPSNH